MNRFTVIAILSLCVVTISSCDTKEPKAEETTHCPCIERNIPTDVRWEIRDWMISENNFKGIDGISFDNYPKVDGSTSANVLNTMLACKLLGIRYRWLPPSAISEWFLQSNWDDIPEQYKDFFSTRIKTSQTHGAFINLIDRNADIILTHRTISPDEKAHANVAGVTLIETSIALDAFVFIVNRNNPVKSLTVDEIQKIYTKKITNWSKVGGKNANMQVFTRPRNSGSEEVFRTLVMNGLEPADFPEAIISQMFEVFLEVTEHENSISYTFNTYKDIQVRKTCDEVPVLAINGICPSENTVKNKMYPFISEVRVAIRSDLDRNSMAYKLYEWLQSESAKYTITECGFFTN
jgi:phosphate transport system substrate-binding protein